MGILTLDKPCVIAGTTHGLMQQSFVVRVHIKLPSPISGLTAWISRCLPELQDMLNLSVEDSKELDAEGVIQWIARLSSALQHYSGEPGGWGTVLNAEHTAHVDDLSHPLERLHSSLQHYLEKLIAQSKRYELAIPCHHTMCGYIALETAERVIQDGLMYCLKKPTNDTLFETLRQWIKLQLERLKECATPFNKVGLLRAAELRNIPWLQIAPKIYQLGYACKARRITQASYTDHTSRISLRIAHDKSVASALLTKAGLPTIRQGKLTQSQNNKNYRLIILDGRMISAICLTPSETIPAIDQSVPFQNTNNVGFVEDVTEQVHPENRLMAERASRVIGLDMIEIDFSTPDISQSHLKTSGLMANTIHPLPDFSYHKMANPHRDYDAEMITWMFGHSDGRIPIAAITGMHNSTSPISHILHRIVLAQDVLAGLSTTQGAWIGKSQVSKDALNGYQGGRILLTDSAIEAAIIELPHQGLKDSGCPFDRCHAVALLDIPDSAMEHIEVDILKRAQHAIIMNAEHLLSMKLLASKQHEITAPNIILIAQNNASKTIQNHLATGKTAILIDQFNGKPCVSLHIGNEKQPIIAIQDIKTTEPVLLNTVDILFTVALAYGMGYDLSQIHKGLTRDHQ